MSEFLEDKLDDVLDIAFRKPRKKYVREREGENRQREQLAEAGVTAYKLTWPGRRGAPDRMLVDSTGLAKAGTALRLRLAELGGRDIPQKDAEEFVRGLTASVIRFKEHKSGTKVSKRQSIEARNLRTAGLQVDVEWHS